MRGEDERKDEIKKKKKRRSEEEEKGPKQGRGEGKHGALESFQL